VPNYLYHRNHHINLLNRHGSGVERAPEGESVANIFPGPYKAREEKRGDTYGGVGASIYLESHVLPLPYLAIAVQPPRIWDMGELLVRRPSLLSGVTPVKV
jgi:hypothetical protein